jgi:hypothetical protein
MAAVGGKGLIASFKALTSKGSGKIATFSKNKLPASVHTKGAQGVNWVKENPLYATAGAGAVGLAGGSLLG